MVMMMMMVMSCFFYVRNQLIVVVRTRAMNFHAPRAPASRGYNSPLVVLLLRRRLLNLGRRRLLLLRCRLVLLRCLAPSVGVVPQLLRVPMLQVEEWQPTFTADAIAPYFPGGGGRHDEAEGRTVSTKEACGIPSLSQDARTHYCAHAYAHTYAHAQSQACAFHEHANDSCQQNARSIENICGAASTPIRIQEACGIPLQSGCMHALLYARTCTHICSCSGTIIGA